MAKQTCRDCSMEICKLSKTINDVPPSDKQTPSPYRNALLNIKSPSLIDIKKGEEAKSTFESPFTSVESLTPQHSVCSFDDLTRNITSNNSGFVDNFSPFNSNYNIKSTPNNNNNNNNLNNYNLNNIKTNNLDVLVSTAFNYDLTSKDAERATNLKGK